MWCIVLRRLTSKGGVLKGLRELRSTWRGWLWSCEYLEMARLDHPVATVHCVRRQPWFETVIVPRSVDSCAGLLSAEMRRV
jgi:hypothetical protein|tara:strand:- start:4118 stop:4360 length:243 start_codon:yes stop_codon:yes gene_type:complete